MEMHPLYTCQLLECGRLYRPAGASRHCTHHSAAYCYRSSCFELRSDLLQQHSHLPGFCFLIEPYSHHLSDTACLTLSALNCAILHLLKDQEKLQVSMQELSCIRSGRPCVAADTQIWCFGTLLRAGGCQCLSIVTGMMTIACMHTFPLQ